MSADDSPLAVVVDLGPPWMRLSGCCVCFRSDTLNPVTVIVTADLPRNWRLDAPSPFPCGLSPRLFGPTIREQNTNGNGGVLSTVFFFVEIVLRNSVKMPLNRPQKSKEWVAFRERSR